MNCNSQKGSLTVEAMIIMVYVIGIIFLMIHISNSLYQKVYLQSVADEAVEMAQRSWKKSYG